MSGYTVAEKIIRAHADGVGRADDVVIARVDAAMATDTTAPFAIEAFRAMQGRTLWNPERMIFVIDHASPAPTETIANLHAMMRRFARETGAVFHEIGRGIGHQVMIENAHVRPGELVMGADSHSVIYGGLNVFASGVGSTDLAAIMLTGRTWLRVPRTICVELIGLPPLGISPKDLTLAIVGRLGIDGATGRAIEYVGPAVEALSLAGRLTMASMAVEMGAVAGLVDPTGLQLPYDFSATRADANAVYEEHIRIDVRELEPQVALPHSPDHVQPLSTVAGRRIDMAFIGTCTNGRLEDLHAAAAVLRGARIAPHVRLVIAPASRDVFAAAARDGTLATLIDAGAAFITPGCGPCVGTHLGVPGNAEVVISAANRNFQGRMGNPNAQIYLASPATVAASALAGVITPMSAPREPAHAAVSGVSR